MSRTISKYYPNTGSSNASVKPRRPSGVGTPLRGESLNDPTVSQVLRAASLPGCHGCLPMMDTRSVPGVPVVAFNSLAWATGGKAEVSVQMPANADEAGVTLLDKRGRAVPSQVLSHDPKTNGYDLLFRL